MKVVVTGGGGFIGRKLMRYLKSKGHDPVALSREGLEKPHDVMHGAGAVIHLAGIAHTGGGTEQDYMRVNCDLAVDLATAARECGVERFVFVSSSHAQSHPETPYGRSKAEAERRLLSSFSQNVVIVRPTLVYGAGAKGNFAALLRLAALPVPLPFKGATAKRSMVYIENLLDALVFVMDRPNVSGRVFTVTDPGSGVSLAQIIRLLREGAGRSHMLFQARWLPTVLASLGAGVVANKLFGEAVFDGSDLLTEGWKPVYTSEEALMLVGHSEVSKG